VSERLKPLRASRRRRVGALLAMTTLLSVTATLATSSPAAADCPPDGCQNDNGVPARAYEDPVPAECRPDEFTMEDPDIYCPPRDGPDTPPPSFEDPDFIPVASGDNSGAVYASTQIARNLAIRELAKPKCNAFISFNKDDAAALERLRTRRANGLDTALQTLENVRINDEAPSQRRDGFIPFAAAGPVGSGRNGTILVFPEFRQFAHYQRGNGFFNEAKLQGVPTDQELRAVVLLDEVGHLENSHSHALNDPTPSYHSDIWNKCFGPASKTTGTST